MNHHGTKPFAVSWQIEPTERQRDPGDRCVIIVSGSGELNDNFAHRLAMGADATLPVALVRQKDMGLFTLDVI